MTETKKTIYVIGHRNPDTDSICSAIALANLKNRLAERGEPMALSASYSDGLPDNVRFLPARAGHLSGETSYAYHEVVIVLWMFLRLPKRFTIDHIILDLHAALFEVRLCQIL